MKLFHQVIVFSLILISCQIATAKEFRFQLRVQQPIAKGSKLYHRQKRSENWKPAETAIIVCDAWDFHHCLNAVRRLNEFSPRLNAVLNNARAQGATIIHAPSDCMPAYVNHPARKNATQTPVAENIPATITTWCSRIPSEEAGIYPIDQSDGGGDDEPLEHAAWAAKLKAIGRNAALPWKKQTDFIAIDSDKDYISDKGDEIWSILEHRGIKNVILTGVHVNMCVLGRPFGLRQLVSNGKNVVLMRDMTDAMYNPASWPFVNHYTGNDLIISHIEKFICPTITSDQILGGKPFHFSRDDRKHLAIIIAEDEYQTNKTLPKFAEEYLGKHFRISYVWGDAKERNLIHGLEILKEADVALVSVRRRVLPLQDMKLIRDFVASGKPMIGIRTASHAFSLRKKEAPQGYADWTNFDQEVWGGNYHNHYGNQLKSTITVAENCKHSILRAIPAETKFEQSGSLYMTMPLLPGATPLMLGKVEGKPAEPVAWTFIRNNGGRCFYSSIGHIGDFENPYFNRLFLQGILWAAEIEFDDVAVPARKTAWKLIDLPATPMKSSPTWSRCVVRLPASWNEQLSLKIEGNVKSWWDGKEIVNQKIPASWIKPDEYHLLVIYKADGLFKAPALFTDKKAVSDKKLELKGRWQSRAGNEKATCQNMPLPAKFGTSPDILFEP